MKKFTLFFIYLALFNTTYAQSPNWLWASSAIGSGSSDEVANSVATDSYGNIISAGYFSGNTLTFGSISLTSGGFNDIYIVKQDAAGNVLWANEAGGTSNDYGNNIAVDAWGNSIVVGSFASSSITFGSITLTNTGTNADLFIVKYNSAGNVIWATSASGTAYESAGSVSIDHSGNIFMGGSFTSTTVTLGSTTLSNSGGYDFFIAKLDSGGNFLWARNVSGNDMESGTVTSDDSGNVIASGSYISTTLNLGTTTLTNAGGGSWDVFIVKYDSSGNLLWAKTAGGLNSDAASSVSNDALGNIIIVGSFRRPSITFGSITLTIPGAFILKYDASGNVIWGNSGGMFTSNSIDIDGSGNIIRGGYFNSASVLIGNDTFMNADTSNFSSDFIIIKYDSSGNILWAKVGGGTGVDAINKIIFDSSGKIITVGIFRSSSFDFGPTILMNPDTFGYTNDLFIAELDSSIFTAIKDINSYHNMISIFPNPFSRYATINSGTILKDAILIVYNLYGQQVKQLNNITGTSVTLQRDNLTNGLYFIHLIQDNKTICVEKFILTE